MARIPSPDHNLLPLKVAKARDRCSFCSSISIMRIGQVGHRPTSTVRLHREFLVVSHRRAVNRALNDRVYLILDDAWHDADIFDYPFRALLIPADDILRL